MTVSDIARVRAVEAYSKRNAPQVKIEIEHRLWGGIYTRTAKIPAHVMITGALIKIPTSVLISGDCSIYTGGEFRHVKGFACFCAEANRKQIFVAHAETFLTMCFPTAAKTVKEAEEQCTDEAHLLQSREV